MEIWIWYPCIWRISKPQTSDLDMFRFRSTHDDVIKWKYFPRYWPFVWGIHRSPVNSPHKGQWRGALMYCLVCAWINGWVNNGEAGDLRRYRAHYDVTLMKMGVRKMMQPVVDNCKYHFLTTHHKMIHDNGGKFSANIFLGNYPPINPFSMQL